MTPQEIFEKTMSGEPRRRRIMKEFKLDEISFCDVPAQEGAVATIMKSATRKTAPTRRDPAPMSFDSFEEACAFLKANGQSGTDAMREARRRRPDLLAKFQSNIPARPVEKAKPRAEKDWATAVAEIATRDKVGRTEATRRARRERADLVEAMQRS